MANVFISHRGKDHALAERLGRTLRRRGHAVWLDVWEINVGDSIIAKINSGLSDASFLLACLSDQLPAGPWMDREWMAALALQLEGADVRVLPVRLSGGSLPSILADIKYADLTLDWSAGVTAICKAME